MSISGINPFQVRFQGVRAAWSTLKDQKGVNDKVAELDAEQSLSMTAHINFPNDNKTLAISIDGEDLESITDELGISGLKSSQMKEQNDSIIKGALESRFEDANSGINTLALGYYLKVQQKIEFVDLAQETIGNGMEAIKFALNFAEIPFTDIRTESNIAELQTDQEYAENPNQHRIIVEVDTSDRKELSTIRSLIRQIAGITSERHLEYRGYPIEITKTPEQPPTKMPGKDEIGCF